MQLDQVLGLAARAIQALVDHARAGVREVGDDEADVETLPGCLDAGDGAALPVPAPGPMADLTVVADDIGVLDGAPGADRVGDAVGLGQQRAGPGQAEDIVDASLLAKLHELRAGVVASGSDLNWSQAGVPSSYTGRPNRSRDRSRLQRRMRRSHARCRDTQAE